MAPEDRGGGPPAGRHTSKSWLSTELSASRPIAMAFSEMPSWRSMTPKVIDPDDDKLLETALMGAADCLVTGDRDLLGMSPFQNIPILSPTGFPGLRTVRRASGGG